MSIVFWDFEGFLVGKLLGLQVGEDAMEVKTWVGKINRDPRVTLLEEKWHALFVDCLNFVVYVC